MSKLANVLLYSKLGEIGPTGVAAFLGEFLRFSSERTHQRVSLLTLEVPEYWYDAKVVGRRQTLEEGEESKAHK